MVGLLLLVHQDAPQPRMMLIAAEAVATLAAAEWYVVGGGNGLKWL